jgi:transposase
MPKNKHPSLAEVKPVDALSQINLHAAGLDIGAEEIYACVPADRAEPSVRAFATFTATLYALADWLAQCGVDTVAMESTGVYWIPVYEILESRGFEVCLVNARHLKNVAAKQTDVLACQWIQQLHTYGLLRPSFRPADEICALRALVRQRKTLIRYRSAHIQHLQKALQQMNVQLVQVVSDITGVTGMAIIRAIVRGERDPQLLAQMRDPKCAHSEAEIVAALTGNYRREHLFVLQQSLAQYDFYDHQIRDCDAELEAMYDALAWVEQQGDEVLRPPKPTRRKPRKNQAHFDLATALYHMVGVDLTAIDGIDALSAQAIIAEIGLDMSKWPTVKHFTSWLGLAPHNKISGGKVLSRRTLKTKNQANTAFRLAAQSLSRSHSALGSYYRRMRAKLGPAKANVATAHKLARIVYRMLKDRQAYVDPGEAHYDQQYRERTVRNLKRRAAELGFELTPTAAELDVSYRQIRSIVSAK